MRAEQEVWLERELTAARSCGAKHVVLLSHVSPFMGDEDEAHGHFNWAVEPRRWVLDLATKAGVKLWLCGHYHGNCVVRSSGGLEVVTTGSCGGVINWSREPPEIATNEVFNFMECVGNPPVIVDAFHSGMRLVRVSARRIQHAWIELANVPKSFDDLFAEDGRIRRRDSMVGPQLDLMMDLPTLASANATPVTSPGAVGARWDAEGSAARLAALAAPPPKKIQSSPAP